MVANRVKSHRNREQWGIHWIRCKFPYLGCYTFTILCIWELFLCIWELFPFKQIYLNVEIMLPSLGCCGSYIFLGILLELSVHSFQCLLCIINKQLCRKLLLFVVFHKLHMWARLCASRSAPPRLQLAPSGPLWCLHCRMLPGSGIMLPDVSSRQGGELSHLRSPCLSPWMAGSRVGRPRAWLPCRRHPSSPSDIACGVRTRAGRMCVRPHDVTYFTAKVTTDVRASPWWTPREPHEACQWRPQPPSTHRG